MLFIIISDLFPVESWVIFNVLNHADILLHLKKSTVFFRLLVQIEKKMFFSGFSLLNVLQYSLSFFSYLYSWISLDRSTKNEQHNCSSFVYCEIVTSHLLACFIKVVISSCRCLILCLLLKKNRTSRES